MPNAVDAIKRRINRTQDEIAGLESQLARDMASGDRTAKSKTLAKLTLVRTRLQHVKYELAKATAMKPKRIQMPRKR